MRNVRGMKGRRKDDSDGDLHEYILCTRIPPNPRHIRSLTAQAGDMSIFGDLEFLLCRNESFLSISALLPSCKV